MKVTSSDVIVIGGGIMGSSSTFFLRQQGLTVNLLERDQIGQHASGTNFGNVRRQGRPFYQIPLANRASDIWRRIPELLGRSIEYVQGGHMRICYRDNPDAVGIFEQYANGARELDLALTMLSGDAVRQRFPFLGPDVLAGSLSELDGHANPRLISPAFAYAAKQQGAGVYENTRVIAVEKIGTDFHVLTEQGELFTAPNVLITTGAWGTELCSQMREPVPLTSFGPTMSVTEPVTYSIKPTVGVFTSVEKDTVYFRQIPRGNVIIGGSTRSPGYPNTKHTHVRPENTLSQLEKIQRLAPALAQLSIIRVWSGTEGYLPDGQPVMGPSAKSSGLYYALGFSGAGFQLGPGVGETMAELIANGTTSIDLSNYAIERFSQY